jgi:hypothetical protein
MAEIVDSREILARIRADRSQSNGQQHEWPEPKPLPNGLAPVESFSSDFLPDALAPWVDDIANDCSARLTMSQLPRSHHSAR